MDKLLIVWVIWRKLWRGGVMLLSQSYECYTLNFMIKGDKETFLPCLMNCLAQAKLP